MFDYIFSTSMIAFSLELLFAVIPFTIWLEKKDHFIVKTPLFIIGTLVLIVIYSNIIFFKDEVTIVKYGIFCFSIFAIYAIDIQVLFKIKFKEALFAITCSYLVEHMAYSVREIINHFTKTTISNSGEPLYFIIHIGIYVLAYFLFAKQMITNKHYNSSVLQSLWLTLVTLTLVLFMSLIAYLNGFNWIHSIYALFACFVVLISQVHYLKQLKLESELNFTNQLRKSQRAQYELSRETIEIINSKSHDLKHFVSALKVASSKGEYSNIISSMENSVDTYDSFLNSGNEILDTLISEKSLICNSRGIKLLPVVEGALLNFMDTVDLYTMIGNALDNSIEACMQIQDSNKKFISFKLTQKVGLTFIIVENYTSTNFKLNDTIPKTTKKDKLSHGFGLKSIKNIAEKYDGFINIKVQNGLFKLEITIPCKL